MPHKIQKLSMRAIVSSMASVEDLPPFVYLADGLRREGIQCHFAVPSNLIAYVKDKGFPVTQLGPDELGDAYLRAEPDLHGLGAQGDRARYHRL